MKLHLLQQALTTLKVARQPAAARAADGAKPPAAGPAAQRDLSIRQRSLAERIEQQVRAISPDDPYRRRRLLRCTLEACLLAEWGEAVADDPAFHALVDRVQQQIEEEPSLQSIVDDALDSLAISASDEHAPHDRR